jgi:thioredoxin 1
MFPRGIFEADRDCCGQPVSRRNFAPVSALICLAVSLCVWTASTQLLAIPVNAKNAGNTKPAVGTKAPAAAKTSTTKKIAETKQPSVFEFGASYCVPCKKFAPTFEKMKQQYAGKVAFQSIDIEDEKSKALVEKYKVVSVPKLVVVDAAGKIKYEHEGIVEEKILTEQVNKVVGK